MGLPVVSMLGPNAFESILSSSGDPVNGFLKIVDVAELITSYLFKTLLGIIVFIDLKKNWRLIGIPLLTIILPVFGVTLFIVRNYYINQNVDNNE